MKDFIEIETADHDTLRVASNGAKITLSLQGTSILGSFARGDGKNGITHPCTPVFGPDRNNLYGLKQHGNMRNETIDIKQVAENIIVTHTLHDEGYPEGMSVKQIMGVEDGVFSMVMIHTNMGTTDAAVNAGEHCYFEAPEGYEGTKINGEDITSLIKDNWDGIPVRLEDENTIEIPGKPKMTLTQNGFAYAMVWVGKNPDSKALDQTYICIEPVEGDPTGDFFGSDESMIKAGQSRSAMFSLGYAEE